MSAQAPKFPTKIGLIGLQEAADYLGCSHQYLGKLLNEPPEGEPHELSQYFRHYAGRWRTTYALLDEYFTNAKLLGSRRVATEEERNTHVGRQAESISGS